MRYVVIFSIFAAALCWFAAMHGGAAYLLLWPAVSFLVVAAGYAGLGAAVFAKKTTGHRAWWGYALLLPFLAFAWLTWSAKRLLVAGTCCHQIASGIWLGRRPYVAELPEEVTTVVDLTCEFCPARGITRRGSYACLPVLDASTPFAQDLIDTVRKVAAQSGGIYIHCAAGFGRSAMFAAALLIARGFAPYAQSAEQMLRSRRSGVRMTPAQKRLLEQVQQHLHPSTP